MRTGGFLAAGILVLAPISSSAGPRPMPQLCDPLYWAIQYHDVEKTTALLRQGVTRFSFDLGGDERKPLHLAAGNGDVLIVKLLLAHKANPNEKARMLGYATPLHSAAQSWNPAVVPLLVRAGADVNARADHGITPLLKAVFSANRELICALIDNGADLNAQHSSGKTSLHAAVDMGKRDLFMLLLSRGADINIRDLKGRTALDTLRARKGPMVAGKELPRYVAKRKAWIAAVEAFLSDPDSVPSPSCSYTEQEFKQILKNSYSYIGIQTRLKQGTDWVPFNGDLETLRLLLRYRRFRSPSDALLAVVKSGNWPDPDSVAYLLEKGADINVQDERGKTPLHYAVRSMQYRLLRLLIMREANPRIRDKDGNTPIEASLIEKRLDRNTSRAHDGHVISTNSSSRHQCYHGPPYYEFQHHAEKACGTYVEVPSQCPPWP
jgi:ankyrin repeat protein